MKKFLYPIKPFLIYAIIYCIYLFFMDYIFEIYFLDAIALLFALFYTFHILTGHFILVFIFGTITQKRSFSLNLNFKFTFIYMAFIFLVTFLISGLGSLFYFLIYVESLSDIFYYFFNGLSLSNNKFLLIGTSISFLIGELVAYLYK